MKRRKGHAAVPESGPALPGLGAPTPSMLCEQGLQHLRAGRHLDAQVCCQRALELAPDDADAMHLAGLLAFEAGGNDDAMAWFSRAIARIPKPEYLTSLGAVSQRMGRFDEALQAFEKAVQLQPDVLGWKNLANQLFDLQRMDAALQAYLKVLEFDPRDWDAACRSGYIHYRAGQLEQALACFGVCDSVRPNHAPTLYMRSVFLRGLRRYEQAVAEGERAHVLDPADADTCNNVGVSLKELHRYQDALPWFERAIERRPGFEAALFNKTASLAKLQRITEARAACDGLIAVRGAGSAVTDFQLAELLIELDRLQDALTLLDRCNAAQPNQAATLQLRAVCLRGLGQREASLADSQRAYELEPWNAAICNNIGVLLNELGRYREALPWMEKASALRPHDVETLNNLADTQVQFGDLREAAATYDRVRAIDPGDANAALGAAHLDLLNGNFEAGWAGREARWKVPGLPIVYPTFSQPMWLGKEGIAGKTILIYADEGMGDAIQLARYLPDLADRGATVILAVHAALQPLLSGVAGVSQCVVKSATEALPPFDMFCPMLSLPLAFGTRLETIPARIPYLPPPAAAAVESWNERLASRDRLRVGLVWSGNPKHARDAKRSIPLGLLKRLLDVDATFVSLQKELRPEDKSTLEQADIVDPTADLRDFTDTAALLRCLDLVITVDTSVAHLAGALGRPAWVLLPYSPDYRWLLGRDDSPWYPSLRLFRQTESREYGSVVDRVRAELVVLAQRKTS
jgi:tetratricopeptide (TPR) repeat protein